MGAELSATFNDIERRIRLLPVPTEEQFRGATEQEMLAVGQYAGCPLPEAYREFLGRMGGDGNRVFYGSLYRAGDVVRPDIREHAERLLQSSADPSSLPSSAFVFLMHEDYLFYWFNLTEGDNPPVYRFSEAKPTPKQVKSCYTDFILSWLAVSESAWSGPDRQ